MGVLIDSSVLIEFERRRLDMKARLAGRENESFFISVATASELLHGVLRARDPALAAKRAAVVEALLEQFPILEIDLRVARAHAQIWAKLAAAGTPIGANDLWLAATCIAHGLSIATINVREFHRVPGLPVEEW